jgi:hypothetical protein
MQRSASQILNLNQTFTQREGGSVFFLANDDNTLFDRACLPDFCVQKKENMHTPVSTFEQGTGQSSATTDDG